MAAGRVCDKVLNINTTAYYIAGLCSPVSVSKKSPLGWDGTHFHFTGRYAI